MFTNILGVPKQILASVFYDETTEIKKGSVVYYKHTYTGDGATESDGERFSVVGNPSITNNRFFAGVVARDYSANSSGQFIDIYRPGSVCECRVGVNTTIGVTRMNPIITAGGLGTYHYEGLPGKGQVIAQQTTTNILYSNYAGTASVNDDTITITGTPSMGGAAAGDKVVILTGEAGKTLVAGEYEIESITGTSTVTIVLTEDGVSASACVIAMYIYDGTVDPVALCYIMDGEETGGIDWTVPATVGSISTMGTSYIFAALALGADVNLVLADGAINGQRKAWYMVGTPSDAGSSYDYAIQPTSSNILKLDGTALGTAYEMDASAEYLILEWYFAKWITKTVVGVTVV